MLRADAPLPSLPSKKVLLWVIASFLVGIFAVYGQSLKHDFVGWDDGMLVYDNPAVRQITPASVEWVFTHFDPELYIPLTFLTYQIDYKMGAGSPLPFHLGNVVLHTLNALLVTWLIYLFCDKKWVALFCGAVFALHPLNTESVDWVSARKDVLSTFFFFAAFVTYLHWRDNPWPKTYVWCLVLFTLGLMAKVMIVTLPVVLVLTDIAQGRKISKEMFREKIWFLVPAMLFGLIAVLGKTEVLSSAPLSTSVLMAFKSSMFYIQQLFWPHGFSVLYPYADKVTIFSADFAIPIVCTLGLIAFAWTLRKRWPELPFGLAFFFLTLAPTFTNVAKGGELDLYFASDRYAYIPAIGIIYAVTAALWRHLEPQMERAWRLTALVAGSVLVTLGVLSYWQAQVWKNTQALFANVIRFYPSWSYVAHNNLGNSYRMKGEYERAVEELKKSLEIREHPKTYSNLGAVYRKMGQIDLALEQYNKALALSQKSKEAHFGLGILHASQQAYEKAIEEYNIAIDLDARYEEAYSNRGAAEMALGRREDAVQSFKMSVALNPFFAGARFNHANALAEQGKMDEAIDAFYEATQFVPGHIPTRINLGLLLYNRGDVDAARAQFQTILSIDPNNATAKKALSQIR